LQLCFWIFSGLSANKTLVFFEDDDLECPMLMHIRLHVEDWPFTPQEPFVAPLHVIIEKWFILVDDSVMAMFHPVTEYPV
jgi:hypothetical protein